MPIPGSRGCDLASTFGPEAICGQVFSFVRKTRAGRWSKSYTWGSYLPDTVRAPTVPPPCPHACGWLAAAEVLNIEKSVGAGLPQIKIGGPNGAFAYSIAPRTVKNQGGPPRSEEHT